MRWILCGKNTAAVRALTFLAERGDEVWAVGTAGDDGCDRWQASFRGAAERLGSRFDQPPRINDPLFVGRLAEFAADGLISIQYDQILGAPLFSAIGCPCLNLHFSLLPRHRGVSPVAWAILSGDSEAGVTLHHMVPAIDAGHGIDQRRVPIDPGGTARELYDALSEACFDLFRGSYPFPGALLERRVEQDLALASYHRAGDFDFGRRRVDWSRPADELHAWLRAMIFPPFPQPGCIVARDDDGVEVATAGGTIRIIALGQAGDPARPAESRLRHVATGDRLL